MSGGHLILVRHGQSESNAERRFALTDTVPITRRGRAQAQAAGMQIAARFRPARLLASPMRRAWQTAQLVSEQLELVPEASPALQEQDIGELRGWSYEEMLARKDFDPQRRWDWRPPGGESLLDVQRRAMGALNPLAAGEDVVAVSHHGTIVAIWAWAVGDWDATGRVRNGSVLVVPRADPRAAHLLEDG